MKIFNKELLSIAQEEKLSSIIHEIVQKEYSNLNSIEIKGIKIIKEGVIHKDVSARMEDGYIILPINKISNVLDSNNEDEIDMLKSNIIHEMYHVQLYNMMPNIHGKHKKSMEDEDYITTFTIIIYIEYLAHLESVKYETIDGINKYYESINNYNWNFTQEQSNLYMIKHASYIIARADDNRIKDKNYIENLKSSELKERIIEVKDLLKNIKISDDYEQLLEIERFVSRYISN